ncbi:MAG TPA: ketopantoate reductase family protein [Rectinema sp.]|jgi:2-dehydropantoate 2-reductase|nr:ketopantoate reductase family protein [Spirochaetota bacterium]NLH89988.1 ketopantoate reductase family protein [Treponema sp.]HNV36297.1 ketopantoate reductase family protein [Rectinema sp.]HPB60868.1 ketopantoate reductase family protein [Rectinema sp.]HPW01263.1 ketopantoate reductase family protein [Rectinema sp.]
MKNIVSVVVVGAGAIGASIAVRLMEAGKQVVISANGERKARYLKQGFVVNGRQYFLPVKDKYEADPADLVIIAVKNYSLEEAIEEMRPYVSVNTIILSLLNGIDAVPRLRREFGEDSVPYAMILGIDALREENRVQYLAKGRIFCGFEKEKVEKNASTLAVLEEFFRTSDIAFVVPEDIVKEIWFKFMINVGLNQWSALIRAPYRLFQDSPHGQELLSKTMIEVISLSKRYGGNLEETDIDRAIAVLKTLAPQGKTSMLQDVEARRQTEVDAFAGAMKRLAKAADLDVPINAILYDAIRAIEDSFEDSYKAE